MRPHIRRLMLGLGAALLVGGWGTTRYADEQQQTVSVSTRGQKSNLWSEGRGGLVASKTIYAGGVLSMALGAGLIGFAIPRPRDRTKDMGGAGSLE